MNRFLTSPKMSKYLRIPGIIALTRAWILFTVLTLQVLNWWPLKQSWALGGPASKLLLRLGNIIGGMKMEKVCWQVFLSVCVGLICSGLASGLDRGRRRDVGAGFNLVSHTQISMLKADRTSLGIHSCCTCTPRPSHITTHRQPRLKAGPTYTLSCSSGSASRS